MADIKTNKMLVNVVLDRSGSMNSTRAGTISGYNEYINGLKQDTASEYSVTLIQFDAHGSAYGPELTISYVDKPLAEVPDLNSETYEPRGGTPLYDAIGECVRRVEVKDRAVTVVVITDGEENASKEFTKDSIKKLISEKESAGWTFVFIGADIDAYSAGSTIGMSAMNSVSYTKGMESNLYAAMAQSTMTRSHSNANVGVEATRCMAFFDDTQKMSVGDPTVSGGQSPVSAGFQGLHPVNRPTPTAPVVSKSDTKRRKWQTTSK